VVVEKDTFQLGQQASSFSLGAHFEKPHPRLAVVGQEALGDGVAGGLEHAAHFEGCAEKDLQLRAGHAGGKVAHVPAHIIVGKHSTGTIQQ
jgi:hypothetical protein